MDHILYSITTEHDARWLLAAGLICILGMATALHLLAAGKIRKKASDPITAPVVACPTCCALWTERKAASTLDI